MCCDLYLLCSMQQSRSKTSEGSLPYVTQLEHGPMAHLTAGQGVYPGFDPCLGHK